MGHDGKRAVQIMPTPIRVVCANTLNMAERDQFTMIKVAHTANATTRLDQIQGFIRPHLLSFDATMEMFQVLARAQADAATADVYLKTLFPDPTGEDVSTAFAERVRGEILAKFEGDLMGYDAIPAQFQRSYWTLYNSVTEYIDHDRGSDKHRLNSAWFGSGNTVKAQALELVKVAVA
jgi:phage/plasmid-like protein (TIGR03299 family)